MTKHIRRDHAPAFKAKAALAGLKARRRWLNWCSVMTFTRTRSWLGRRNWRKVPLGFSAGQRGTKAVPAADLKSLQAKLLICHG